MGGLRERRTAIEMQRLEGRRPRLPLGVEVNGHFQLPDNQNSHRVK